VNLQRRQTRTEIVVHGTADVTRRMVCGGLAGMIAKTATNPLERIKMLSQTGEAASSSSSSSAGGGGGIVGIYRTILQREGVAGLWAGNGANLLRVFPAKAVVFSSNDAYRELMAKVRGAATTTTHGGRNEGGPPQENGTELPAAYSFAAGGMAGMTASACTYPLDLARGRISGTIAAAGTGGGGGGREEKAYRGVLRTVCLTVRDEGVGALYRGVTPTLLGAVPYEGIKFGTVGLLEGLDVWPLEEEEGGTASPLRKMCFGGAGGVAAGLITYPNDTVRRMLQLQGGRTSSSSSPSAQRREAYAGYWDCVRRTVRRHGVARLYRGCSINLLRMAPNTAVQFGSYELLKRWTRDWF
jgi:solute carrier family 25 phosphate transporter 23/24/25/41